MKSKKNYFLFVLICIIFLNCNTKTSKGYINQKSNRFLLVPSIKNKELKGSKRFINYKNIDLTKKIDIENNSFSLTLKNDVIFEGSENCDYTLEVFDKSIILISKSNYESNKYISAYHSFIRDEIYFFDIKNGYKGKLILDKPIYIFPIKSSNISTDNNQYFIKRIDFSKKQIIFIDSSNNERTHQLQDIVYLPIKCISHSDLVTKEIKEYYPSGLLKSEGKYVIDSFVDCGVGGLEDVEYKYKFGTWKYYHPNKQLKAIVNYKLIRTYFDTRCNLNEQIRYSKIDTNYKFFNEEGIEIEPPKKEMSKINCTTQEKDDFFHIEYCYDLNQNKVRYKITKLFD